MRKIICIIISCIIVCLWVTVSYALPNVVHVNLFGDITSQTIQPLMLALKQANVNTMIYVSINSTGGQLTALFPLLDQINKSKAKKIVMIVPQKALSAAALIAVAGTEIQINDDAVLGFHTIQQCKNNAKVADDCHPLNPADNLDPQTQLTFYVFLKKFGNLTRWFLSEDDWDRMLNGENLIVYGKDLKKRCEIAQVIQCNSINYNKINVVY